MAEELAALDPDHAADYAAAADRLAGSLAELDEQYAETLAPCRGATLLATHEAFGYLADRYSYSTTFLVTAAIQLAGTALQIPLIFITRKAESPAPRAAEGGGTTAPLHAAPAGPEAAGGGGAGSAGQ